MPLLSTETVIKQYYETIKDNYPDLTYDKVEAMIKSAFWYFNKSMGRDDLPTIHIKNFAKIVVLPSNVQTLIVNNNADLKYKNITPEEHFNRKIRLEYILKEVNLDRDGQILEITEEDNPF